MDVAFEDRVRSRAYEIWEAEGRPSDRSIAHWDQAMKEIASLVSAAAPAKTKAKKAKTAAAMTSATFAKQARGRRAQPASAILN